MWTCWFKAKSLTFLVGLTLKPIMIPWLALANSTSLSLIVPTALLKSVSFTPGMSNLANKFLIASSEPLTSVFKITFNFLSPVFASDVNNSV